MAFSAAQFTVTAAAPVQLATVAAGEVVMVVAYNNPVLLGPSNVTATTGLRLDPGHGPVPLPASLGSHDLYGIALNGRSAQVHILRKPNA